MKACSPSTVPENVSAKYPSTNAPAAPPMPGCLTPRYTARTSRRSGTTGRPGSAGNTVVWSSMAATAATASTMNVRTRLLLGGRRRLLHRLDGAARHQHLLELIEVD